MGTLNDIFRQDGVHDYLAAISASDDYTGYNVLLSSALFAAYRNVETISATKELADVDYPIQVITAGTTNQTVELPIIAVTNHLFWISCAAASANSVLIKDDSGATTFETLAAGEAALCLSNGAFWKVIKLGDTDGRVTTEGRLTLASGTPVTTTDQTAKTTVYFTPYKGNNVMLYTGSVWFSHNLTELSVSVPATTTTPFDIFIDYNAGSPQLVTTNWTNDTTRATALTTQDGVYVQVGNTDWKYLGTGRTTSVSGQIEDSLTYRGLWNYYNRIPRAMSVYETTSSWAYSTASYRQINANTANKVEFVVGISEDRVFGTLDGTAYIATTPAQAARLGIGLDSISAIAADCINGLGGTAGYAMLTASYAGYPGIGYHYLSLLENSGGSAYTFFGSDGSTRRTGAHFAILG